MLLGLTLKTKPEDIYRALIESTAFATKQILDNYQQHGLQVKEIYAAGGITGKNPFLMQLYADILGMPIHVCTSAQASAKGSAVFAAIASGYYKDIRDASAVISDKCSLHYVPVLENTEKYRALYREYRTLCEYFATINPVMKRLKKFSN
jgi:L-ribulokinase